MENKAGTTDRKSTIVTWIAVSLLCLCGALLTVARLKGDPASEGRDPGLRAMHKRATALGRMANPIERDRYCIPLSAMGRMLNQQIPADAKLFVTGILGHERQGNGGFYYSLQNYLYPRVLEMSVAGSGRFEMTGFGGVAPTSDVQLASMGYSVDIALPVTDQASIVPRQIAPFSPSSQPPPVMTDISSLDCWIAWLIPVVLAMAGMRLIRLVAPQLALGWGERWAVGMGVGVLLATQLHFGARLAGLHIERWLLAGALVLAGVEVRGILRSANPVALLKALGVRLRQPDMLFAIPLSLLLLVLFRLGAVVGLQEFDAIAFWEFKAKILFHAGGRELLDTFSRPLWGYAHFDYPLLVPSAMSLTYGVLGHVNEFVTKLWPAWLLSSMAVGTISAARMRGWRGLGIAGLVAGICMMPITVEYAQNEGGTIPLLCFTVMAFSQTAIGAQEGDRNRLLLGLVLMLGAAMTKFEGFISLFLWAATLLLWPRARRLVLVIDRRSVAFLAAAGLILLPYLVLRLAIPVTHFESLWPQTLKAHTMDVMGVWPQQWLMFLGQRLFIGNAIAYKIDDHGAMVWSGSWDGMGTFLAGALNGFAWIALAVILIFVARRAVRAAVGACTLVVLAQSMIVSLTICSVCLQRSSPGELVGYASGGGRYLLPLLSAWGLTAVLLFMRSWPAPPPAPEGGKSPRRIKGRMRG